VHALQDAQTGLVSLVSIVEDVRAAQLPLVVPALYIFARITDAHGDYVFTLELVRRDDAAPLGKVALPPVTVEDPTGYAQMVVDVSGVVFERAGAYDFTLSWNDRRFLGTTSIRVIQI
jgi:hypothetical protein